MKVDGYIWEIINFMLHFNDMPQLRRVHQIYENIGINHLGFVIDDGEAMEKSLNKHGIEYYTMSVPETKYRIYVNDPDGDEIELVEYHQNYPLK